MLIEDQYGVGDSVSVLEIEGVVEKVGPSCNNRS
jgi:hypothetical protein